MSRYEPDTNYFICIVSSISVISVNDLRKHYVNTEKTTLQRSHYSLKNDILSLQHIFEILYILCTIM